GGCDGGPRALAERSAGAHTDSAQGGSCARPVRDHPPVPRWERTTRSSAHHAIALRRARTATAHALSQSLLQDPSPDVLRQAPAGPNGRGLGGLGPIFPPGSADDSDEGGRTRASDVEALRHTP